MFQRILFDRPAEVQRAPARFLGRLRDAGEQLLKEAGTAMATKEDADPLMRELAVLREECRTRRLNLDIWNVIRPGDQNLLESGVREMWQKVRKVAYGVAQKAPPREPDQVPDVATAHRALDEVVRWCEDQERSAGQATQVIKEAAETATHTAELSLAQTQAVARMADLFVDFDFLPNSDASYTWREAAAENGLIDYWQEGSKRPVIVRLLESALQHQPDLFCGLVLTVVRQGIRRRQGKSPQAYPPITREAIDTLNRLLSAAGGEIPAELNSPAFLNTLPPGTQDAQQAPQFSVPAHPAVPCRVSVTVKADEAEVTDDLPAYKDEEQPWFTPLAANKDIRSEDLTALADEIDLVIITATDTELEAVLRVLKPYPR